MNKEEIIKQFVKEHINWLQNDNGKRSFDEFVADFALSIMIEAEDKAWEAARMHDESMLPGRVTTSFVYETINDWRKEKR